jgi:hypothetical protein
LVDRLALETAAAPHPCGLAWSLPTEDRCPQSPRRSGLSAHASGHSTLSVAKLIMDERELISGADFRLSLTPEIQLASTQIRKAGLGHGLLSYLFGTVLLAVAVSLLTNLS